MEGAQKVLALLIVPPPFPRQTEGPAPPLLPGHPSPLSALRRRRLTSLRPNP